MNGIDVLGSTLINEITYWPELAAIRIQFADEFQNWSYMKRNRKESLICKEAAVAFEALKKMIRVRHGKFDISCWSYLKDDPDPNISEITLWGLCDITYVAKHVSTCAEVQFLARIRIFQSLIPQVLYGNYHELEIANSTYNVTITPNLFHLHPVAGDIVYVGTGEGYRWVENIGQERPYCLEYSI